MKIRRYQNIRCAAVLAAAALAAFTIYPARAFAVESITLPVEVMGEDVVSISLPVISESETSVFDFILDPQGLLYSTDAARYGGGRVEEGATLLFHNEEGEYDFSNHSDRLTVTNRSTVPVRLTVTAQVMDFGDVRLAENADFGESTEPAVYLAIEDDQGNILPLSADEQTTINLEMSEAPANTYVFRLDEENHTYQYEISENPDMVDFDTYSFGLIGACNSNAEWQNISVHPTITVTWYVEPIIPEEEEELSKEVFVEEKKEDTISSDDIEEDEPVAGADDKKDENNASDGLEDEEQSDHESKEENGKGDVNDGSDDEEQSDNESDAGNGKGDVNDGSDDEEQSGNESEAGTGEGDANDGLDDEKQPGNESDVGTGEGDVNDGSDDGDQSNHESDGKNNDNNNNNNNSNLNNPSENNNGQNAGVGDETTE